MNTNESQVSEEAINEARQVFSLFDKKGTGKIQIKELGNVFKAMGKTLKPEQLKEWSNLIDVQGSGWMDFDEFKPLFVKKTKEDDEERELREAFRLLDRHNKGCIDVEDLRVILRKLSEELKAELDDEQIEDMIRETDADGSGEVDFDEFYKLMTSD